MQKILFVKGPHLLTCFIFSNAGRAVHPAFMTVIRGDSTESPIKAQALFSNKVSISSQRCGESKWL